MTIVKQVKPNNISTHALVIGVGRYPQLKDGDSTEFPEHEEMGQLDSPPYSAVKFSKWLLVRLALILFSRENKLLHTSGSAE